MNKNNLKKRVISLDAQKENANCHPLYFKQRRRQLCPYSYRHPGPGGENNRAAIVGHDRIAIAGNRGLAFDYGVAKSTICESIKWVEYTLLKSGEFSLPSKRKLLDGTQIEVVLVDATECEIERPQKSKVVTTPTRKRSTH